MKKYSIKDETIKETAIYVAGRVTSKDKPTVAVGVWFSLELRITNAYLSVRGGALRATLAAVRHALIYSKGAGITPTVVVEHSVAKL